MLSKCANPDCCEQFRYLHQGKLFHLTPIPELQSLSEGVEAFHERFWLCDRCCLRMKVVWDGTQARIVSLPAPAPHEHAQETPARRSRKGQTSASHAGR